MSIISFYATGIRIWVQAHYLSYKYKQNLNDIYFAYMNLYGDYKIVRTLCQRCHNDNMPFDIVYDDLINAKNMIEDIVKVDKNVPNTSNFDD